MSELFFIVGLPRTRTAWLANFLTNGNAFCHHELMRTCTTLDELEQKMTRRAEDCTPYQIVGDADPCLTGFLADAIGKFPEAKWVVILRDVQEANESYHKAFPKLTTDLHGWTRMYEALKELSVKGTNCCVINYEELDTEEACNAIHEFCLGRPMDVERWKLLHELRVTAVAEKARTSLAPWAKLELIRQADPQNDGDRLWYALLSEICAGKPLGEAALQWLQDLVDVAMTWDHVVDEDPVNKLVADRAFESVLLKWPFNPFWAKFSTVLTPMLSNAVAAWRDGARVRHYDCFGEPALAVAFLLGGPEHVQRFSKRVHDAMKEGCRRDDQRDEKKQATK